MMSPTLEGLRGEIPELAKDIKLNLDNVLGSGVLSPAERWGAAVAAAAVTRNARLLALLAEEARRQVGAEVVEDALAAAVLMEMNNVYYRSRHVLSKHGYAEKPARLRMTRLAKPATSKANLELYSLAVSAINGCETCLGAHARALSEAGLTDDHVHDAIRVAATINAVATALDAAEATKDHAAREAAE